MRLMVLAAAAAISVGGCVANNPGTPGQPITFQPITLQPINLGPASVNPDPVPGANYAINCPSAQLEHCFAKAKELCPRGYEVVRLRRSNDPIMMVISPDRLDVKCQ